MQTLIVFVKLFTIIGSCAMIILFCEKTEQKAYEKIQQSINSHQQSLTQNGYIFTNDFYGIKNKDKNDCSFVVYRLSKDKVPFVIADEKTCKNKLLISSTKIPGTQWERYIYNEKFPELITK